jgi:hypothetical protein
MDLWLVGLGVMGGFYGNDNGYYCVCSVVKKENVQKIKVMKCYV